MKSNRPFIGHCESPDIMVMVMVTPSGVMVIPSGITTVGATVGVLGGNGITPGGVMVIPSEITTVGATGRRRREAISEITTPTGTVMTLKG